MTTTQTQLLKVTEVARRLNCSRAHVYTLIERREIPALRLGSETGPLRVPADELERWLYSPAEGDAA